MKTIILILFLFSATAYSQFDSSHYFNDKQIQAFEKWHLDAGTYKQAYDAEHTTRLKDSSNYVFTINTQQTSKEFVMQALKDCQAEPKTTIEYNSKNWYFYALGGSAITVITYFIIKSLTK